MDWSEHADAAIPVVFFRAGGYRCAIEAAVVAGMGMASPADGPVEALLGLDAAGSGQRRALHLKGAGTVTVEEPVDLGSLPAAAIQPLPPLLAALTTNRAIVGLALDEEGIVLLLALQPNEGT